jgi:hypothetical protein
MPEENTCTRKGEVNGRDGAGKVKFVPLTKHVGFLLGLFFVQEDGGDMFLRNTG